MPPATRSPNRATSRSGAAGPATGGLSWNEATLGPVVLVSGAEDLLADRAVERLVRLARDRDAGVEVSTLEASEYSGGTLGIVTSPSLFGEDRLVIVSGVEHATDELITDVLAYIEVPQDDVVLVVRHAGGQRGKKLLDRLRAGETVVVHCEPVKKDAEKAAFVSAELRVAGRRADAAAVRALVDAVGSSLRELASACSQIVADTSGPISADVVERYYGGRIEASGFRVADAAIEGNAGHAVALLRHALATGVDPVPIVAALAAKLRILAKVAATRGRGAGAARDLGLAPWQVDRALRDLSRWTPESLAAAITAVAQADSEVKGASRDPRFAVERAVLRVASSRGR